MPERRAIPARRSPTQQFTRTLDADDRYTGNGGATFTGNTLYGDVSTYGQDAAIYSSSNQITVTNNTIYNIPVYGIYIQSGTNSTVTGNFVYGNSTGLNIDTSTISGNIVHDNINNGIVSSNSTVSGNTVYNNTAGGTGSPQALASSSTSVTVTENITHGNKYGVYMNGVATVSNNLIYNNTTDGIVSAGGAISGNVIRNNGWGIQENIYFTAATITNNVIYANTSGGLQLTGGYNTSVTNNTIYQTAGDAFSLIYQGNQAAVTLRNNILWTTGGYDIRVDASSQANLNSDYNDLYATGAGQIGFWQGAGQASLALWRSRIAGFQ